MKTKYVLALMTVYSALLACALGQAPSLVNYQGRLLEGGVPVNGNVVVAIGIYSSEAGVAALYLESVGNVPVVNGLYAFTFGSNGDGMVRALANPEAWLEVKIDTVPLTPRQRLIAVPYSRNSAALGSILAETPTPTAGAIRWSGIRFEGYDGFSWLPLSVAPKVIPQMVTVGNAGNPDYPPGPSDGAVSYEFQIGKFEVTNFEYTEFLNAVDPSGVNALALYNTGMNTDSRGGISNNTSMVEGKKYIVKSGSGSKPVVFVSFYDAMRFCNWLHNGAVAGGDTENGAYTLLGGTAAPSNGTTVQRNAEARFNLPSLDEWKKAAFYDPVNAGADAGGSVDYWYVPTQSDSSPVDQFPPGGANSANYDNAVNNVTVVGAYTGSPSHYGTFDQGGNVAEWCDTGSSSRSLLGDSWNFSASPLEITIEGAAFEAVDFESNISGFRVASPTTQ